MKSSVSLATCTSDVPASAGCMFTLTSGSEFNSFSQKFVIVNRNIHHQREEACRIVDMICTWFFRDDMTMFVDKATILNGHVKKIYIIIVDKCLLS